jgi:hypothetical protein
MRDDDSTPIPYSLTGDACGVQQRRERYRPRHAAPKYDYSSPEKYHMWTRYAEYRPRHARG